MNNKKNIVLPRTDLAKEILGQGESSLVKRTCEYGIGGAVFTIEEAEIDNDEESNMYSKPVGKYITVSSPRLLSLLTITESLALSKLITQELKYLCPSVSGGVTVVGMGNREMTVDSLGVRCAEMIKPSRSDGRKGISVIIPGVEASTGISAFELVSSVIGSVKPSAVIAVDSLAARSPDRLGTTVQLCNSGISPGSGLGKRKISLNRDTIGIPVVSIGIPTVISASSLLSDISDAGIALRNDFYVGLVESDAVTEASARIISVAIENAFS